MQTPSRSLALLSSSDFCCDVSTVGEMQSRWRRDVIAAENSSDHDVTTDVTVSSTGATVAARAVMTTHLSDFHDRPLDRSLPGQMKRSRHKDVGEFIVITSTTETVEKGINRSGRQ